MRRLLFKYAIFIRVITLAMGCTTVGPTHTSQTSHTTTAAKKTRVRQPVHKVRELPGIVHSTNLKGKGTDTEAVSRNVTSKKMENWDVTAEKVKEVAPLVELAAAENNLPTSLIYGVIWVESRFNPEAESPVGAMGLMQLMPRTATYLAECIGWEGRVDAYDPEFNIAAGAYYVARLIKQFGGDVDLALAAYNAGPGNVSKWMKNTGLPEVSIEYYTMVQTAQGYFGPTDQPSNPGAPAIAVPSDDDLDKLGLAILIAGLSDREFGLERTNDANPFQTL